MSLIMKLLIKLIIEQSFAAAAESMMVIFFRNVVEPVRFASGHADFADFPQLCKQIQISVYRTLADRRILSGYIKIYFLCRGMVHERSDRIKHFLPLLCIPQLLHRT